MTPCIYPGPHGEMSPEHYLPAALGTFEKYEPLQDRVCRPCNTYIGDETETQFLRSGPIGLFRWMLRIEGRDGLPPSPFYRGAAGAARLVMLHRAPDAPYDLLWEVEPGTETAFPMRQIIFDGVLAGVHPIAVLDWMRGHPERLIDELRERGLERALPIRAFAADDEIPWVTDLVRAIGGQAPGEWTNLDYPPQRAQLVVTVTATDAHFRAVTKIVFHYALKVFPDLTGLEREFESIKNFIWSGGDVARFVRQRSEQFVQNFVRGERPTHWMHILAVVRSHERIVGYAQFFAGPRSLPPPYEVVIGRNPASVATQTERRAHQFVILNPGAPGGIVGRMEDGNPAHLIWIP